MANVISYQQSGAWFWMVIIGKGLATMIFDNESAARALANAINARR